MVPARTEPRAVLPHGHLRGVVVLGPEVHANFPEVLHGLPAGPYRARAAHTVTLAFQLHVLHHCLDVLGNKK